MKQVKIRKKKPESVDITLNQLIDLLIETRKNTWKQQHEIDELKNQISDLRNKVNEMIELPFDTADRQPVGRPEPSVPIVNEWTLREDDRDLLRSGGFTEED